MTQFELWLDRKRLHGRGDHARRRNLEGHAPTTAPARSPITSRRVVRARHGAQPGGGALGTLERYPRVPSLDRMPNGRSDRRELRRRLHLEQRARARGGGVEHLEQIVLVLERHDRWDRLDTYLQSVVISGNQRQSSGTTAGIVSSHNGHSKSHQMQSRGDQEDT